MVRVYFLVLFVLVAPVFQGCGILGSSKGESTGVAEGGEPGKGQVSQKVARLRLENVSLKKEIEILKRENEKVRKENLKEIAKVQGESRDLNEQLKNLREENQRITDENRLLKERLEGTRQKKDLRKLKIKVLSGDGNLSSAKQMAKRLIRMDYEIGVIGYAPRSNFKKNTVYFAPRSEKEGRNLVSSLGGNTILKPLTWPSVFDLIVVTAK